MNRSEENTTFPLENWGFNYCHFNDPESNRHRTLKVSGFVLVSLSAVTANVFIIVLALKCIVQKNLHHLIINMSVSDTILVLLKMIYMIPWLSDGKFSFFPDGLVGNILCKFSRFIFYVSYVVSLVTLFVISVERLRATKGNLLIQPYTLKQRVTVLGCCWFIPMVMFAFIFYSATISTCVSGINICTALPYTKFKSIQILLTLDNVVIMLSFLVIFLLNILTVKRLAKTRGIHFHLNYIQQYARGKQTRAAVGMVLSSLLLYTCCWLPPFVLILLTRANSISRETNFIEFTQTVDWNTVNFIAYDLLPVLNAFLSPCIYIIFVSDFQKATKKLFCKLHG